MEMNLKNKCPTTPKGASIGQCRNNCKFFDNKDQECLNPNPHDGYLQWLMEKAFLSKRRKKPTKKMKEIMNNE